MTPSTEHNDRRFFWVVTGTALLVAAGPYLIGLSLTPPGHLFQGNTVLAPGDPNVYYSYIEQARQGAWLMRDVFTSEAHQPTLWQPVWLILGWLANLFQLPTPVAYALGRLASVVIFSLTVWWAIRWLWPDRVTRRFAMLTAMGASGLGGLVALVSNMNLGNILAIPPDLWVSEMVPILSSWTAPHFLLVTSGMLYVLVSVERSWSTKSWSRWWLTGLVSLITLSIHPFHLLTWVFFWVSVTTIRWWRSKKFPTAYVCNWGAVLLVSLPALLYHLAGAVADPLVIGRASQNINLTPSITLLLVGLGLLPILAGFGFSYLRRQQHQFVLWLGSWAIVHLAVIYFPFTSQRRLMHALVVPLALLAAVALTEVWKRWGTTSVRRSGFVAVALITLSSSTVITGAHIINDYRLERQGRNHWEYFLTPEYQNLFSYLKTSVPSERPILASLWNSNLIAGFTARTVVVGHPVETLVYEEKISDLRDFYSKMTTNEQAAMLRLYHVCYVLNGPRERGYGTAFHPEISSTLAVAWAGPTMTLYRVTDCLTEA